MKLKQLSALLLSASAALTFSSLAYGFTYRVPVSGLAVLAPAQAQASPSSLAFPSTAQGSTSTAVSVTVSNTGGVPLTVNGASTGTADFQVTGTNCGTVPAGGSCQVDVAFTPQTSGALSDSLSISTNVGASSVALSGTAYSPASFMPMATTLATTTGMSGVGYYIGNYVYLTPSAAGGSLVQWKLTNANSNPTPVVVSIYNSTNQQRLIGAPIKLFINGVSQSMGAPVACGVYAGYQEICVTASIPPGDSVVSLWVGGTSAASKGWISTNLSQSVAAEYWASNFPAGVSVSEFRAGVN